MLSSVDGGGVVGCWSELAALDEDADEDEVVDDVDDVDESMDDLESRISLITVSLAADFSSPLPCTVAVVVVGVPIDTSSDVVVGI